MNSTKSFLLLLLIVACLVSCEKENKKQDFLTISGIIQNVKEDSLKVFNFSGNEKILKIGSNGSFKDTLKLTKPGMLFINYNKQQYRTFAKNNDHIELFFDSNNIEESISFANHGNETQVYFKNKYYGLDYDQFESLMDTDSITFTKKVNNYFFDYVKDMPKNDTVFTNYLSYLMNNISDNIIKKHKKNIFYDSLKGKPAPIFKDYENYNGSKTSLTDFKGKYLYIDIWATWCKPCLNELPHIKKLQKEYQNKDITFLSISIDQLKNKDKWKEMIKNKKLDGYHLISPKIVSTKFMETFKVTGIPHFILLDPKGNIIKAKAPRPSQHQEIRNLFNTYL